MSDEKWGAPAAKFIANSVSLLIILPILVVLVFISSFISYNLGLILLFVSTIINLGTSIFAQAGFTISNLRDFGNIFGALIGMPTILVRNTEDLTSDIVRDIEGRRIDKKEIELITKLSENDLHKSQVDLETVNFRLALIAIITTIFLSQQILDITIKAFISINNFLFLFSETTSQILGFSGILDRILSVGVYFLLWGWFANIALSLIYQTVSSLLFVYFNNYRAAYSLQQALLLFNYQRKFSEPRNPKPKKKK
jgi:hypothetical protein